MATRTTTFGLERWRNAVQFGLAGVLTKRAFWAVFLALALAVGGRLAWNHYSAEIVSQPRYELQAENLLVTQQPSWIKSNVAKSALRSGGLAEKSLLDPSLVEQVHGAFAIQTWVREVVEVRKSPQGVHVQLTYRRPVGMVELEYEGTARFQPVDDEGVLLPGLEFSPKETWGYIKIAVHNPVTQGLIHGTPWPDSRVLEAAKLASLLNDSASGLGIYRIQQIPVADEQQPPLFELHLINHDRYLCRRIVWGRAPGSEIAGEAMAEVKLEQLLEFAAGHQDWLPAGDDFDLTGFDYDVRAGKVVASNQSPSDFH